MSSGHQVPGHIRSIDGRLPLHTYLCMRIRPYPTCLVINAYGQMGNKCSIRFLALMSWAAGVRVPGFGPGSRVTDILYGGRGEQMVREPQALSSFEARPGVS